MYFAWSVLMQFEFISDGIDAVVIDNFYTEQQLEEIHTELKWLTKKSIMVDPSKLVAAVGDSGQLLTSKNGIFLEEVFVNWQHSALISHGMTQTADKLFVESLLSFNGLFKSLFECNSRNHLLSYYENSDYYKSHKDGFFFTILNYFNVEPRQFTGGEIVLKSCNSSKEATIEILNNRTVVIASATSHEVKEIKSSLNNSLSGNGRYCNAMFLTYNDPRNNK
jgi:hypothetical protein